MKTINPLSKLSSLEQSDTLNH